MSDWCAKCGQPLKRLDHGAYAQCCRGVGYLSTVAPLPADKRFLAGKNKQGLYFYPSERWYDPKYHLPVRE
jgi:hypothetical protein